MKNIESTRWATALCALVALPLTANAQPEAAAPTDPAPAERATAMIDQRWHGDIVDFHVRDFSYWRTGYWVRDTHEGRGGWWWVVGDTWYPYQQVVFPYPDPYTPAHYAQPTVIGPSTSEPYPPQYLYYCVSADNYYPYIPTCKEGWMPARVIRRNAPPQ